MLSRKKRFSSEYTMLSILEYRYNSQIAPISKYNIVTNTLRIKRQRPDRVNLMMDLLQSNGYISSVKSSNATLYQITDKGLIEYAKWIKNFLDFPRAANTGPFM